MLRIPAALCAFACVGALPTACGIPSHDLDLVSAPATENVLAVQVGVPVLVVPPPVGGVNNNWSFTVDKKPAKSGVGGTWFDADHWSFTPDADGDFHVCGSHDNGDGAPKTTACGTVSAITHLSLSKGPVHVERERAILDGFFAVSLGSNEPVSYLVANGVIVVGSPSGNQHVPQADERFQGPVTSDALGTLQCELLGAPGPTAVCPSPAGKAPPLGDHVHWKNAKFVATVTFEDGVVNVDADVVSASTTGPKLTSLVLSNHGTHFVATIDPPVTASVTIAMKADDPNFAGGFAQLAPSSSSTVEGDLKTAGQTSPPSTAGTYDVVTRVTSSTGEGIATFAGVNVD